MKAELKLMVEDLRKGLKIIFGMAVLATLAVTWIMMIGGLSHIAKHGNSGGFAWAILLCLVINLSAATVLWYRRAKYRVQVNKVRELKKDAKWYEYE